MNADRASSPDNYRIEVSGWGLNDAFFVEKTDLHWTEDGSKRLLLHHAVPEGAVIFARLIAPENSFASVPVAYRVESIQPMKSNGLCEMRLLQLHPRTRAERRGEIASSLSKYSSNGHEPKKSSIQPELEEVLHEA
jgi:hypothetical protein